MFEKGHERMMSSSDVGSKTRRRMGGVLLLILLAGIAVFVWNRQRRPEFAPATNLPGRNASRQDGGSNSLAPLWTQFRGSFQGHSAPAQAPPMSWSETTNVAWKTEVPGLGWSSPVVSEDKVWLTAALRDGRSLHALAFDKATGKLLIDREVISLPDTWAKHAVNSHASPTPVLERERVFVAFGPHGIAALNAADGSVLWKNTDLKFDDEQMGGGASPILTRDFLVIHCDGTDQRFIVALNKTNGQVAWKTPRSNAIAGVTPFRKAFSTPVLHTLNGVEQLISASSYRIFGYEPETGRELWAVETPGFCPVPVPLVQNDWIFVCAGFDKAQLCAFHKEPGKPPKQIWKSMRSVPQVSSPVLVEQHIFMVSDGGIASCVEAASGRTVWHERLGGKYWASLLHCDGRIYCFAEDGKTTILAALPEFKVMATNRLDGEIMATPAMADTALFLRTKSHLYRLQAAGETDGTPKAAPAPFSAPEPAAQP
jgi:outer membrane protein assembly factor BamB